MNEPENDLRPRTIKWDAEVDLLAKQLSVSMKRGVSELLEKLVVMEAARTGFMPHEPSNRLVASLEKMRLELAEKDVTTLYVSGVSKIKASGKKKK